MVFVPQRAAILFQSIFFYLHEIGSEVWPFRTDHVLDGAKVPFKCQCPMKIAESHGILVGCTSLI